MTCYAIGHLRNVEMGAEIFAYLEAIDCTLAPFEGRFIIHGGQKHVLEGEFAADLIVIAFPDLARAQAWYASSAYRNIKPLRTRNAVGDVFLIEGVDTDHKATDVLSS
ncbi:DUF1330 domain-containing protein [Oceanicola sp. 502str15]|uniref:DUF1330 domain-containing protein n=1 Tax=Oceanicola sp. 502str15 TaxID=2696061 RepID=UPI0020958C72|nr:DUF1330 domain-containing protein [Oceanicola sp. 502str15]MCO6383778.1 DUF1330 domain-containing protein [Oceanicola sp. 502str15]